MKKIPLTILFFCCINFLCAQAVGDYQTAATGNWNVVTTWQTWNGTAWVTPGGTPNNTNGVITVQAGHTVTVPASVTVDELIVNGTMNLATTITITIFNGTGVDLQINGTFGDFSTPSIIWNAGATWQMGSAGTLIKTTASSSNNWQANYQGGIALIPSTSNWILRKIAAAHPTLSSTTPVSGSVYPNLTLECNTAGAWTTPGGSSFVGSAAFPTVKGNLDIGGSGTNTVDFLNSNTNVNPLLVMGNVLIRAGCNYRNFGTGIEIRGNLTATGSITYDANDGRKIVFSGTNNQTINGTGALNIYDLTLNKSAGTVTLNQAITVDNLATFTGGIMFSTAVNLLSFAPTATVTNANNASFVSGPVRYYGTAAFIFPVGKNSDYQPLAIGSYTATGGTFWTENFNNGCTSNCQVTTYSGVNGAWSVTNGVNSATPNLWFVSCAENGNAVGACGSGCGANATLHLGAVGTSDCGCLVCPSGDCGAAYDACNGSTFCGGAPTTDKRAESPVINCTGRSGITLGFKYIEGGQTTIDNATVWYFDGVSWAQLADPAKTLTGCSGQGIWTSYSVSLPASADNNPNVRIGFRWVNNSDGLGSDPSFAVDDVILGTSAESFTAEYFYANPQVIYNNNLAPTLNSISACEYWILNRLPLSSTAATSVTLTWDANSCPAIPLVSDTRVAHFDLTTWQDEGNGGNTGTTTAGTVVSAAPVTYFSPFTIALIPPTPLPIEMTRFEGSCTGNEVTLRWATATETGNNFFTVERSADGITFSAIGNMNGGGTSTQVLNYLFKDENAFEGTNYYRIKQTDYNGQFAYGKIIVVDTKDCNSKSLELTHAFFNSDDLEIDYLHASGTVTIEVYNAEGRLIRKFTELPPENNYHINAADWSKSIYFVRISDGINSVSTTIVR
ncbi:MAG: T9SS type A sorting domain-containing protein [Bacteroidota bacterium]|nr:T9SS type A sorting domain-containing protein [Bacteroidota bacterium]